MDGLEKEIEELVEIRRRDLAATDPKVRTFETGATRDTEEGKWDPEGFLHPDVIEAFCEYMHKNRLQKDGSLRASDNWQKGIPLQVYAKSLWRHFLTFWRLHRVFLQPVNYKVNWAGGKDEMKEALCAMMFNVMGFLYEYLKRTEGASDG